MKKRIYILLAVIFLLSGTACEKYLDVQPSVDVSEEQLFENLSGFQVVLNGVYKYMLSQGNFGMGATGICCMQAYNMTASPDIWIRSIGNNYYNSSIFLSSRTESSSGPANGIWEYNYRVINNCNIILSEIGRFTDQPEVSEVIKGQAHAIRGWAYFNLIRYFQQTYIIAADQPGVPVYTDRASPERSQADRSTVTEVYQQIISDLTEALDLLQDWERPAMEYINTDVVHGFLAQVYLTMQNWSAAASHATLARQNYSLMSPEEFTGGFDVANTEWMWGFHQTENDNIMNQNLFSKWGINGHRPAGAIAIADNTTRVNESFVNMFDVLDCRNQFYYVDLGILNSGWASDKFRDDGSGYYGDIIVMRAAEMYLIEAEALARQAGQQANALDLLNELQNARLVETITNTTVQADLLDAIWIESRKELYGEGQTFFNLLRLEKDLVKAGDAADQFTIPAHSWQFVCQIPDDEMNFGGISAQNPLDGIFIP